MAHHEALGGHMLPHGSRESQYDPHLHLSEDDFTHNLLSGNRTVLNQEDQEFLDQFWENPNDSAANDDYLKGFMMDQRSGSTGDQMTFGSFAFASPTIYNPATTLGTQLGAGFATHSNSLHPAAHAGSTHNQATHHGHGDTDVTQAASSLFGMAGQSLEGDGAQWGGLNYIHTGMNSNHISHSTDNHATAVNPSAAYSTHGQQLQRSMMGSNMWQYTQQQQQGMHGRQNSLQAPQHMYYPQHLPQNQWHNPPSTFSNGQSFKTPIQWGSDQNFSVSGFRGQVHQDVSKDRNLLGVPGATQAAVSGYSSLQNHAAPSGFQRQFHPSGQSTSNAHMHDTYRAGNGHGTTSLPSSPADDHHSRARKSGGSRNVDDRGKASDESDRPRPRKRRRSIVEDEGDAEYAPSRQRTKARPSTPTRPSKNFHPQDLDDTDEEEYATASTNPRSKKRRTSSAAAAKSKVATPNTPQSSMSSESPVASGSKRKSGDVKSRQNLSDTQKRDNHIKSEQRRRNLIKDGYADIERLVPSLKHGKSGMSKSDALFETVNFIERLTAGNAILQRRFGIRFEKVFHAPVKEEDDDQDE